MKNHSTFSFWRGIIYISKLIIIHFSHCIIYALPTLAALMAMFYMFEHDAPFHYTFFCGLIFLVTNTLFVYAVCRQMLKEKAGSIDIAQIVVWKRQHSDFFIFISLGIFALAVLSIYFLNGVGYLAELSEEIARKKDERASVVGFAEGSYSVLILGSKTLAAILLALVLWIWFYICRAGVRIPAHVEGYYIRYEEAQGLTRDYTYSIMALSLLFLFFIVAFCKMFIDKWGIGELKIAVLIFSWAVGYFMTAVLHIAMWVYLYITTIKNVGYFMARNRM